MIQIKRQIKCSECLNAQVANFSKCASVTTKKKEKKYLVHTNDRQSDDTSGNSYIVRYFKDVQKT